MSYPEIRATSESNMPGQAVACSLPWIPEPKIRAALRLHEYLFARHWNGRALVGPDVGIRFNSRIGRFIKGYLPTVPWSDDYCYIQAQGYWVLDNWRLYSISRDETFREIALRCSEFMLQRQRDDGAWEYPNPEWRGRIATAEGTWGSLGLLESYRQTRDPGILAAVCKWHDFLVHQIGFQKNGDELAVNYFQARKGFRVPNNSAIVLRFLAELAEAAEDGSYRRHCDGLLSFLQAVQLESGEFPYTVRGESGGEGRVHFQCYQYNAFLCLDLMRYVDLTQDTRVLPMIWRVLGFLRHALAEDGHSFFDCGNRHKEVTYHTAVLAQTLAGARRLGIGGYGLPANRAYQCLLGAQRKDGGFGFSRGDYLFLSDERAYPRNLAMILYHLLPARAAGSPWPPPQSWQSHDEELFSLL